MEPELMGGVRVVGSRTRKGALLKGPSGRTGESCFSAFSNTSVPPECPAKILLPHTNLHRHRYSTPSPVPPEFVHSFIFLLMTQRRETLCTHSKKHAHNCCHRQAHTGTHALSPKRLHAQPCLMVHTSQVYTCRCGLTWHTPSMAQCKLPRIVIHAHTATVS